MTAIVGAGLAGLLAAHAWPTFAVLEAAPEPRAMHKALLRFRTDNVSRLTGIEFRKVLVRKGLWSRGQFCTPNIALANEYSKKVIGRILGDRSIWNLDPVERFIAPETLYEQLVESVWNRITWGMEVDISRLGVSAVSTIPLPTTLNALGIAAPFKMDRAPIRVQRFRLKGCDVHQTVYFPDPDIPLYRASITGDLVIAESTPALFNETIPTTRALFSKADDDNTALFDLLNAAFGVDMDSATSLGETEQKYGKIAPVPDDARKQILFKLTHDHNIYSLGRFAIWSNILLDDVANDIAVVRKLMRSSSYDMRRAMA
jgi:hypothetical protein